MLTGFSQKLLILASNFHALLFGIIRDLHDPEGVEILHSDVIQLLIAY